MIEHRTNSSSHTEAIAKAFARGLRSGDVVALSGALGAGKTTFVRGLARGLGIDPNRVSSPTFVLCHEYEGAGQFRLIHIDAYRLSDESDLESLGWDELLNLENAVIAVEWPERISGTLPEDHMRISLEAVAEDERLLTFDGPPRLQACLDESDAQESSVRKCPKCGQAAKVDSAYFPFCSDRCRMADLGRWFSESYRVSRPAFTEEDDDEL